MLGPLNNIKLKNNKKYYKITKVFDYMGGSQSPLTKSSIKVSKVTFLAEHPYIYILKLCVQHSLRTVL